MQRIGESGCRTVHACLTSAASNPLYRASNPAGMNFYADCADLPYMLRAYYAWKNGLPFSYSTAVTPLGYSKDIRYTARGNLISSRRDLVEAGIDARRAIPQIVDTISSAHYRYPPAYTGRLLPDHYPVKIARDSIKPGTIIYDPNGHVAVIYKVTAEGRIHYIDTHPDNSLTRGVYGKAFARSSPGMGAGFKRWRPLTLVGATQAADGSCTAARSGSRMTRRSPTGRTSSSSAPSRNRPKLWSAGRFALEGETLEYYDYVRRRLANAGFKYDPLEETRSMVRSLCEDLKYRVDAVDVAIKAGIHKRPQPDRLPNNIYGTDGDWETYSTPSRDARLKTAFKELRDEVARFLTLAAAGSDRLAYAGSDIRSDIRQVYAAGDERLHASPTRAVTAARSSCPSPRWSGACSRCRSIRTTAPSAAGGRTMPRSWRPARDAADKRAWYEAEQRLRNQPDRTYDVRMGFSLADLRARRRRHRHRSSARHRRAWRCSRATRQPRKPAACSRRAEAPAQRIARSPDRAVVRRARQLRDQTHGLDQRRHRPRCRPGRQLNRPYQGRLGIGRQRRRSHGCRRGHGSLVSRRHDCAHGDWNGIRSRATLDQVLEVAGCCRHALCRSGHKRQSNTRCASAAPAALAIGAGTA